MICPANSKLSLIRERKRKLVLYNQESDGPLNWQAIKTRRLNCFAGCGAGPSKTRALAIAFSCRPFPFGDRPYQFLPLGLETAIHTYEEIRAHEPQQENQDKSLIIVTCKACDWHVLCLNFLMYCDMHASLVIASCVGDVSCFSARRWTC